MLATSMQVSLVILAVSVFAFTTLRARLRAVALVGAVGILAVAVAGQAALRLARGTTADLVAVNEALADKPEIFVHALGHQQVNDAWLVEVARQNSGRLATLDTRLAAHALKANQVEVIPT